MVPSLDWFLSAFVRKEAVLSSPIEGTQATLVDLLTFEAEETGAPDAGVEEVCNYVRALTFARQQRADERGLPLSMRLLNEAHRVLMDGVRGAQKGARRDPAHPELARGHAARERGLRAPPPHLVPDLLGALESYVHAPSELPPLVRAGLVRIGRLLVTLLLEHWRLLSRPVLYLSLFFKRHRSEYDRRLDAVRTDGAWEGWLDFFLDGVAVIATQAVTSARELFGQIAEDRARVLGQGTTSVAALRLFEALPRRPIVTVAAAMRLLVTTKPTVGRAIDALVDAGVLVETTGRKRNRSFSYQGYLDRLRVGTELDDAGRGRPA